MRHVDDGTMHAWLDQQVSDPVDITWIGEHLRECAACRARLEEERVALQQAEGLLASVAPAADTSPSAFAALVERAERIPSSRATTVRFHTWVLAAGWAASVAMAVALGWVGRDLWSERDANEPHSRIAAVTEDERRGASSIAATSSAQRAAEAASPAPAREVAAPAVLPPPSPSTAKRAALASSASPEQPRSDRLEARESKAEPERPSTAPSFRGGVDSLSAADAVQLDAARLRQGQGQGQGQAGAAAQPEAAARKAAEPGGGGGGAAPQPPAPAPRPLNSQEAIATQNGGVAGGTPAPPAPTPPPAATAPGPPPAAVASAPPPAATAPGPPPAAAGGAAARGGAGGGRGGGGGGGGGRGGRGALVDGLAVTAQSGTPAANSLAAGWQALSRTDAAARSGMALYGINGLTPMTTLLSPDGRAVRTLYRRETGEVVELTQQRATDETNRANDPPASTATSTAVAEAATARQQPVPPATVWSQIRGDVRVTLRGATDPDSLAQQFKLD